MLVSLELLSIIIIIKIIITTIKKRINKKNNGAVTNILTFNKVNSLLYVYGRKIVEHLMSSIRRLNSFLVGNGYTSDSI